MNGTAEGVWAEPFRALGCFISVGTINKVHHAAPEQTTNKQITAGQ